MNIKCIYKKNWSLNFNEKIDFYHVTHNCYKISDWERGLNDTFFLPAAQFSLIFFHLAFSIFRLSNGPRAVKSCDIAGYASSSKRMQRSHFTRMTFNAHANCRRAIRRKQLQRRINEASWITSWKEKKNMSKA